ncbi:MAG: thiamine phosphate synthase [Pseudomonadota bacterium]
MELKAESDPKGKFRRACIRINRHFPAHLPPLMVLTDPYRTPDPIALALSLPPGTGLIYRHFGAEDRQDIADRLARIAKHRGLCFLLGNDPELARHVKADGVHWSEARMGDAKPWRRSFFVMTAAAHSRLAISRASALKLDAILVSTIFPSNSSSAKAAMGPFALRKLEKVSRHPIYALGGINAHNVQQIARFAGAASIEGAAKAFLASENTG